MDSFPFPLVPADVDLRDFPYMPVDIVRLFGSEFHALSDDAAWRAGVTLWLKSFHQVPAASIPNDDVALARLAELGRDLRAWKKIRATALRGWVECSDGRLYHPVVATKALEAWIEKLVQRRKAAAGNGKRWGSDSDTSGIAQQLAECAAILHGLDPQSRTLQKKSLRDHLKDSFCDPSAMAADIQQRSLCDRTGTPSAIAQGSQEKGREGKKEQEPSESAVVSPARVCARLRSETGMVHTNPSDPRLIAALDAGVTDDLIVSIAKEFPQKSLAYVVQTARGRHLDAQRDCAGDPDGTSATGNVRRLSAVARIDRAAAAAGIDADDPRIGF